MKSDMAYRASGTEEALEKAVSRAFLTSYLLSGSVEQAEGIVLDAIDSFDPDTHSEDAFVQGAIEAVVQGNLRRTGPVERKLFLPRELQSVLNLSNNLRQCFVLRVLAGLSAKSCVRLLGISAKKVDEYACIAIHCLARP